MPRMQSVCKGLCLALTLALSLVGAGSQDAPDRWQRAKLFTVGVTQNIDGLDFYDETSEEDPDWYTIAFLEGCGRNRIPVTTDEVGSRLPWLHVVRTVNELPPIDGVKAAEPLLCSELSVRVMERVRTVVDPEELNASVKDFSNVRVFPKSQVVKESRAQIADLLDLMAKVRKWPD